MKKSLIAFSILTSLGAHSLANASPLIDINQVQVVNGMCIPGFRPVTLSEAKSVEDQLLGYMSKNEHIAINGDWVMAGEGHDDRFFKGTSEKTFCYPEVPEKDIIAALPAWEANEGDELEVQRSIVSNEDNFIKPLAVLAHNLGYSWVSGNLSAFPGDDMVVSQGANGSWIIQGNNSGSCVGFRCEDKTQIIVDNFSYELDPASFTHGEVTTSDKELVKVITARVENNTDFTQSAKVAIEYHKNASWGKTENHSFGSNVSMKTGFQIPLIASMDFTVGFSHNSTWGSHRGESTSEQVTTEASVTVPPHSYIPVKVELYKASISYPYRFLSNVSYDVTFKGTLKQNNAWYNQPQNKPTISHTFNLGIDGDAIGNKAGNIEYQWGKQFFPGETKWWDWRWMQGYHGSAFVKRNLAQVLRHVKAPVTGEFFAESQLASDVRIGVAEEAIELKNTLKAKNVVSTSSTNSLELIVDEALSVEGLEMILE